MPIHTHPLTRIVIMGLSLVFASCGPWPAEPPAPLDGSVDGDVTELDCHAGVVLWTHPTECDGVAIASAHEGVPFDTGSPATGPFVRGLSADGRFVAIETRWASMALGDNDWRGDLYVVDLETGSVVLASPSSVPDQYQEHVYGSARSLSDDGSVVAMSTSEPLLALSDTNNQGDVYVRDLSQQHFERPSMRSDGMQSAMESWISSMSRGGRYVVFVDENDGLVGGDTPLGNDVVLHDRDTGELARVSEAQNGTGADGDSFDGVATDDGRFVAFTSYAGNLVAGDDNGVADVFVKDMQTGTVERVSVSSEGLQGDAESWGGDISADGRYVSFSSLASNLVVGDLNQVRDVFIHDRDTGETSRVSVRSDGSEQAGESYGSWLSADGSRVLFSSAGFNLAPGTTGSFNIFAHDMSSGATWLVSEGLPTSGMVGTAQISSDGNYAAFVADYGTGAEVYVTRLEP